jgi:hypothetical protein
MGQRVAFGTRQDNFATNFQKFNYSGFSGFPFALFTKEEAEEYYGEADFLGESGTFFPFEFTLNELAEFWWRIKKINFGSITIPSDGDLIPTFTISGTIDSYENEIQLAKEISKDFFKRFDDAFESEGESEPARVILVNEDMNCIFYNKKYYPFFLFNIQIFDIGLSIISTASQSWFGELNVPVGTLKYKEKSTTLFSYPNWITNLNIDLTPSEYYAYAAIDGSPIYNTTTGERLQDPRN